MRAPSQGANDAPEHKRPRGAKRPAAKRLQSAKSLVSVGVIYPSNPGMYASIVAIAEALPALTSFSTPGQEVVIVDMHEGFDINTMLSPDGFHGNALGDAFMAQRWFDTISTELLP